MAVLARQQHACSHMVDAFQGIGSHRQPAASIQPHLQHVTHLVMGGRTKSRGRSVRWAAVKSATTVATAAASSTPCRSRARSAGASGAATAGACMFCDPCPLPLGPAAAARSAVGVALVWRGAAARRGRAAPPRMC